MKQRWRRWRREKDWLDIFLLPLKHISLLLRPFFPSFFLFFSSPLLIWLLPGSSSHQSFFLLSSSSSFSSILLLVLLILISLPCSTMTLSFQFPTYFQAFLLIILFFLLISTYYSLSCSFYVSSFSAFLLVLSIWCPFRSESRERAGKEGSLSAINYRCLWGRGEIRRDGR